MGCYDFCGHYEWTFAWLERRGGPALLRDHWSEAISRDSQQHARAAIVSKGVAGMAEYWQHTLTEESPGLGFHLTRTAEAFRIDVHDCPSKGFLLRNGLQQHADYCDHCIGWIGPMMQDAGFVIDHEHNHRGQCWWRFRAAESSVEDATDFDVRRLAGWRAAGERIDRFAGATAVSEKQ